MENKGKRWTEEERSLLREHIKCGLTFDAISPIMKRSKTALELEFSKFLKDKYQHGSTIEELSVLTNVRKHIIENMLNIKSMKIENLELLTKISELQDQIIKLSLENSELRKEKQNSELQDQIIKLSLENSELRKEKQNLNSKPLIEF